MTVCGTSYKGWTIKDEQVTSFVKIFVSQGFENLTPEEYLDANRLVFENESTSDIPWTLTNEYVHHQKHTRIIIAQIPTETYELIQMMGNETNLGSNVWKEDRFMAPLKMTLAMAGDMHPSKPQNPNPKTLTPNRWVSKVMVATVAGPNPSYKSSLKLETTTLKKP